MYSPPPLLSAILPILLLIIATSFCWLAATCAAKACTSISGDETPQAISAGGTATFTWTCTAVSGSDAASSVAFQPATITGVDSVAQAEELLQVFDLTLKDEDLNLISAAVGTAEGPGGPVYALEREREGPHGKIMRYDLNRE